MSKSTPIWDPLKQVEMCLGSPPTKVQLQFVGAKFTTSAEKDSSHEVKILDISGRSRKCVICRSQP